MDVHLPIQKEHSDFQWVNTFLGREILCNVMKWIIGRCSCYKVITTIGLWVYLLCGLMIGRSKVNLFATNSKTWVEGHCEANICLLIYLCVVVVCHTSKYDIAQLHIDSKGT